MFLVSLIIFLCDISVTQNFFNQKSLFLVFTENDLKLRDIDYICNMLLNLNHFENFSLILKAMLQTCEYVVIEKGRNHYARPFQLDMSLALYKFQSQCIVKVVSFSFGSSQKLSKNVDHNMKVVFLQLAQICFLKTKLTRLQ